MAGVAKMGVSLSEYIRRRRMSQAAFELQRTDEKVLDVALKYGYTSPTSFNRAFQSVHGITPAAAKSKGTTLNAYLPINFSVKVTGGNAMPYRIAETEAIRQEFIYSLIQEFFQMKHIQRIFHST